MTNLEQIRNMTEDEIVLLLIENEGGFDCGICRDKNGGCDLKCAEHCKVWLKEEAQKRA